MKKNTIKAFIVAVTMVCLSNVNTFASTKDENATLVKSKIAQVNNTLSFNVWVDNIASKKVVVLVVDADKNEIHREYVDTKGGKFAKTFDFSSLADGKYTIEVISQNVNVVESKTFEIKTNLITNRDVVVASNR